MYVIFDGTGVLTGQYAAGVNIYQFGNVRPLPLFWLTFLCTGLIGGAIAFVCLPNKHDELEAVAVSVGGDDSHIDTSVKAVVDMDNIKSLTDDGESVQAVQAVDFTTSSTTSSTPTDITTVLKLLLTKNIAIYNIFIFIVSFAWQSTFSWAVLYYFNNILNQDDQIHDSLGLFSYFFLWGAGAAISDIIRPFRSDISQLIGFGMILVAGMPLILGASAGNGLNDYNGNKISPALYLGK